MRGGVGGEDDEGSGCCRALRGRPALGLGKLFMVDRRRVCGNRRQGGDSEARCVVSIKRGVEGARSCRSVRVDIGVLIPGGRSGDNLTPGPPCRSSRVPTRLRPRNPPSAAPLPDSALSPVDRCDRSSVSRCLITVSDGTPSPVALLRLTTSTLPCHCAASSISSLVASGA
jgi:hypothetical protein